MELLFRIVTNEQAAELRSATRGRDNQLDPRLIEAGPYAGWYAFSESVMSNQDFADIHGIVIISCPDSIEIDTDVAWPVVET